MHTALVNPKHISPYLGVFQLTVYDFNELYDLEVLDRPSLKDVAIGATLRVHTVRSKLLYKVRRVYFKST